jgi:rod shape determining protein RodA
MNKLLKLDWILVTAVGMLLAIGLLALYSISYEGAVFNPSNLDKQIFAIAIGAILFFVLSFMDYRVFNSLSTKLYFMLLILLILVIIFGVTVRGTTGWIGIASYRFQPVELAKLIMIIFLASFFSRKKNQLSITVRVIVSIILVFAPVFLILKQPDLGSSLIILSSWGMVLMVSGVNKKNLLILIICGVIIASSSWFFLKPYQKDRIASFMSPEKDPRGSSYNVIQSMVAVGSGRITGQGLGHGSQSQLNFLPEKHTDFIFAVIAEELGFFGTLAVFILFGVIFWRLKETAKMARDNFGYLITVGVMAMIFFQMLVNIGMNIGIMPVAGVPLPLISYGGSSMVVTLAAMGIAQSIYTRRIKA